MTCHDYAPTFQKNTVFQRIGRIAGNSDKFYFSSKIVKILCNFKIDSGSDVSILNFKLFNSNKKRIPNDSFVLKYLTGETVPVYFQTFVTVDIGIHHLDLKVFVADYSDDCILGLDFLKITDIIPQIEKALLRKPLIDEEYKIELMDSRPIKQPFRRSLLHLQKEVNELISERKDHGMIRKSKSS